MTETAEVKKVRIEVPGPEGASPEVFEGATEAEVLQKIADAKGHATAKIREQQQALEQVQREKSELEARLTPPAPPAADGFDRDAYFNTLYQDPRKAFDQMFESRFGMPVDDAVKQWERMTQVEKVVHARNVAAQFAAKHTELLQVTPEQDRANANVIEGIINDNGWPYTEKNMEAAYAVALQSGKLKLPTQNAQTEPPAAPATLSNNGGQGEGTPDEATIIKGMSLDQLREYYSSKHRR